MKLTEFFLKRPTLFWSLMVAILLAGIISFNQMPKLEDPAIPIKQCNVVVVQQLMRWSCRLPRRWKTNCARYRISRESRVTARLVSVS